MELIQISGQELSRHVQLNFGATSSDRFGQHSTRDDLPYSRATLGCWRRRLGPSPKQRPCFAGAYSVMRSRAEAGRGQVLNPANDAAVHPAEDLNPSHAVCSVVLVSSANH